MTYTKKHFTYVKQVTIDTLCVRHRHSIYFFT